jgi:hypothetical protein
MQYSNLEKTFISRHILHRFTSASKPAAYKSFECCLSHFRTSVWTSSSSAKRLPLSCEPLYATNTSHRKQETFLYEYPLHWVLFPSKKMHNIRLLFANILFMYGRHFDYWNQHLNMRMRVCYLDCHEDELCCYLVIHVDNLLVHYFCFTSTCDLFTNSPPHNCSFRCYMKCDKSSLNK